MLQISEFRKKRIFIVNTEDHPKHLGVLKTFANFLISECKCDVTFAPWCKIDNKLKWIMNSIDECDLTILVNSAAAYLQYEAWKTKTPGKYYKPITRAGDIFIPAIEQITDRLARNVDISKFLTITFSYTKQNHVINDMCVGTQYRIPKDLDDFLCHIHGLDLKEKEMNLLNCNLPTARNIKRTKNGNDLLVAAEVCLQYESAAAVEQLQYRSDSSSDKFDSGFLDGVASPQDVHLNQGEYDYAYRENDLNRENYVNQQYPSELYVNPNNGIGPRVSRQSGGSNSSVGQEDMYEDYKDDGTYTEVVGGDFHPPSCLGDDDVASHQLRQEILEINRNYMERKMDDRNYMERKMDENDLYQNGQIPHLHESISVGGISI